MNHVSGKTILASGYHSPNRGNIEFLDDVLIAVDEEGMITSLIRPGDANYEKELRSAEADARLERMPEGCYLLPGFIDMHVHAPQYPQLGLALDEPLEVWLNKYTFPLEARYADVDFAKRTYSLLVDDLTANGTTTVVYFATIHEDATRILVDTCLEKGQRAIIGKVTMDNPDECPDYYRDKSTEAALKGTRNVIEYIRSHPDNKNGLVQPSVAPRFIPSCTDHALEGLGEIVEEHDCYVHTHCSEGDWEHNYTIERHGMTDTFSYERFGLLGEKSIMAHSIFLTPEDIEKIKMKKAAIAHCPISNTYFSHAIFPLKAALEKGLKVGIGTDVSGGPNASVFEEMRDAIRLSRVLETGSNPKLPPEQRGFGEDARVDYRDAFYIATTGGGEALNLPIGMFETGYRFDAMLVDTRVKDGGIRIWDDMDEADGILQKIIYTANQANITRVWVNGQNTHAR